MAWYDAERVALVAAVTQACSLGLDELAWELAASTYTFLERRRLLDDWEHTHTAALVACRRTHNTRGQAVMARNLAALCKQRGRDRLLSCADEALAASRELRDRRLEADSLIEWGVLHRHDDPAAARARINEGLTLADTEGHTLGSIQGQLWLAVMHHESGNHDAAARTASRCLTLARQHDYTDRQMEALLLLGASRRVQARYEASEGAFVQALRIARTLGSRTDEARALTSLGALYVHCGRAEARATLERSLELTSGPGDEFAHAMALRLVGELDLAEHRHDEALTHLLAALRFSRHIGFTYAQALILRALGETHAARGDPNAARSAWDHARRLFEQLGNIDQAATLTERLTNPISQYETGAPQPTRVA